jgi:hypothetical protein
MVQSKKWSRRALNKSQIQNHRAPIDEEYIENYYLEDQAKNSKFL